MFFVNSDKAFKMFVSKNLWDEIPESILQSVPQNQAAKGASSALMRRLSGQAGGLPCLLMET